MSTTPQPHGQLFVPSGNSAGDVRRAFLQIADVIDRHPDEGKSDAGAEVANVRRFTLQVQSRRGRARSGRFVVLVWVTTADGGGPGGAQTVATVAGTVLVTITANQAWQMLTDSSGKIQLDVTIAGAATRYLGYAVLGRGQQSAAVAWT